MPTVSIIFFSSRYSKVNGSIIGFIAGLICMSHLQLQLGRNRYVNSSCFFITSIFYSYRYWQDLLFSCLRYRCALSWGLGNYQSSSCGTIIRRISSDNVSQIRISICAIANRCFYGGRITATDLRCLRIHYREGFYGSVGFTAVAIYYI